MSQEERVILFKSPSADTYTQALLTTLSLPGGVRFKLTTYRSLWVPSEIFNQPDRLNSKKALLVCAILPEGDQPEGVYPLRELTIVNSRQLGQQLELLVETGGFVSCPNYDEYLAALKSAGIFPPKEYGFIAYDRLRDLSVIAPEKIKEAHQIWQKLIEVLSNLKPLDEAVFFWLSEIKHKSSGKAVQPVVHSSNEPNAGSSVYLLEEDTHYIAE